MKRKDKDFVESVLDLGVASAQELNDMYVHFSENSGLAAEGDYFDDLLQAFASWRAAVFAAERELSAIITARVAADAGGEPWDF